MYVAEEQQNVASYINFCPKNEHFLHLLMPKAPFFKKLMDRMKGRFTGLSFAACRKHFFDTLTGKEPASFPVCFAVIQIFPEITRMKKPLL